MGMNSPIDNISKEVVALFPLSQLRPETASHIRNQVYAIIFRHVAVFRSEMQDKINDLDRQLYIANKKIEDDKLDTP